MACYTQVCVCRLLYPGVCLWFVIHRFMLVFYYTQVCVCDLLYTCLCF